MDLGRSTFSLGLLAKGDERQTWRPCYLYAWSDPIQVTGHKFDDDVPFLLERRDGTYLLVWTRLDREKGSFLSNKTSETFYATSQDGVEWDEPVAVTNDRDNLFLDILPTAYETKDDCYIVWRNPKSGRRCGGT